MKKIFNFSTILVGVLLITTQILCWIFFNQRRDGDIRELTQQVEILTDQNQKLSDRVDILSTKSDTIFININNNIILPKTK